MIVSDPEVIDIAFDKYKTHNGGVSGLNAPKTYVTLARKEALAKGEISFPLFMKPRWVGSIGLNH